MSDNKSILNWSQTFKMTSRAPAIDDRIFSTYTEMITYCQNVDATAIDGLTLSVSGGTIDEIGSYYVVSGAGTENVLVTKNVTELNFEADDTLNTAITVSKQVGYLNVGKNFAKGTMLETILHEMLEKELTPSVNTNTLSLTITPSNTTRIYEIGDILTCQSVTFNAVRQMKANDYNGNVTPQVVDADAVDLYVKGISGTTELSSKTEQANIVSLVVSNPFGESGTQFTVANPSIVLSGVASGATNTKTCKTSSGNNQVVNFSAVTASANYAYNSYYAQTGFNEFLAVKDLEKNRTHLPWSTYINKILEILDKVKSVDGDEDTENTIELSDFQVNLQELSLNGIVRSLKTLYGSENKT